MGQERFADLAHPSARQRAFLAPQRARLEVLGLTLTLRVASEGLDRSLTLRWETRKRLLDALGTR